jgi:hypothetical protein
MPAPSGHDPHVLLILLDNESDSRSLHVWSDSAELAATQPGDYLPLPDEAIAAGGDFVLEPAAEALRIHPPSSLPETVKALLPATPSDGCRAVIELRLAGPEITEDGLAILGSLDPREAKRVLRHLEEYEIPVDVEPDHSALRQPGRDVSLYLGMNPPGSRVKLSVPADRFREAWQVWLWLFPPGIERPPPVRRVSSGPADESAKPAMDVYAAPASEITWSDRRDFYEEPGERPKGGG